MPADESRGHKTEFAKEPFLWSSDCHLSARERVDVRQRQSAQAEPNLPAMGGWSVKAIAKDRMAGRRKMDPNLMRAASHRARFKQCDSRTRSQQAKLRLSIFAVRCVNLHDPFSRWM